MLNETKAFFGMGTGGNPIKSKNILNIFYRTHHNNLHRADYPHIFVSSSIFDNRVLYSEPVKYIAKLRDVKNDKNIQLLNVK